MTNREPRHAPWYGTELSRGEIGVVKDLVVTHLLPWALRHYGPAFRAEVRASITQRAKMIDKMEASGPSQEEPEPYYVGNRQMIKTILTILDAIEKRP